MSGGQRQRRVKSVALNPFEASYEALVCLRGIADDVQSGFDQSSDFRKATELAEELLRFGEEITEQIHLANMPGAKSRMIQDLLAPEAERLGFSYEKKRYVFEKLVEAAARGIFGGATYRFGWPRDFEQDWPTHINDRVSTLADLLEREILKLPTEEEAQAKDRSLDVVTRVRVLNESGGTGYILIQCATGKNYQDKRSEPYKSDWDRLFDWDSELVRGVAIPTSDRKELFSHFRRFTGAVILDRSRLMHGRQATSMTQESWDMVYKWTNDQLSALPAA